MNDLLRKIRSNQAKQRRANTDMAGVIVQYTSGLMTTREALSFFHSITLPAPEPGELDLNTGLRYNHGTSEQFDAAVHAALK
jgi:hypothetical protein